MKKLFKYVSVILCSLLLAGVFVACGDTQHSVTFDLNYDGAPAASVVKVADNAFVDEPDDPVRVNWEFLGWFTDKECEESADLSRTITGDMTVYAGWKRTGISVTFDLNYEGGGIYGEVQNIPVGTIPEIPVIPEKSEYLFIDWYTVSDAESQTDDNKYSFTALSEDTVIYAGWVKKGEATAVVKFLWNYQGAPDDGVYGERTVNIGSKITAPALQRAANEKYISYALRGWQDKDGNVFAADHKFEIKENTTLSALWTEINTLEAEYTDMSYFQGAGWSWNRTGTEAIEYDTGNQLGSNAGYEGYVANMQMKGAFIYFEIESDRDVTDLTLKLRLSIEAYFSEMELWPEIFSVSTATSYAGKRTYIDYERIRLESELGKSIAKFENYLITANLSLVKGMNYIFVETSANFAEAGYSEFAGNMGAMSAFAPVVDALIIEHAEDAVKLDWMPRVCNVWNSGRDYPCECDRHEGNQK